MINTQLQKEKEIHSTRCTLDVCPLDGPDLMCRDGQRHVLHIGYVSEPYDI